MALQRSLTTRVWSKGTTPGFQPGDAGSIPATRSILHFVSCVHDWNWQTSLSQKQGSERAWRFDSSWTHQFRRDGRIGEGTSLENWRGSQAVRVRIPVSPPGRALSSVERALGYEPRGRRFESSRALQQNAPLAQTGERRSYTPKVGGSTPPGRTIFCWWTWTGLCGKVRLQRPQVAQLVERPVVNRTGGGSNPPLGAKSKDPRERNTRRVSEGNAANGGKIQPFKGQDQTWIGSSCW